jgi:hypothetical protein
MKLVIQEPEPEAVGAAAGGTAEESPAGSSES